MKTLLRVLVIGILLVGTAQSASAVLPFISVWADNGLRDLIEVPWYEDENGIYRVDNFFYETSEFSLNIFDTYMDPDPVIAWGIAVTDFGAPSSFAFLFSTPTVPVSGNNTVEASIVGGLTDFTGDGVSLTPTVGTDVQHSFVGNPMTPMGVDVGSAYSTGPGIPGSLYNYGAFMAGPIAGPGPGPWTQLQANVDFGLSGNGDIAVLTGYASIVDNAPPIPEPATLLLLGGGLAGAGLLRRRKKA